MERETVLMILAAGLSGVTIWMVALATARARPHSFDSEPMAFWRLVLPLFAGTIVLAFLFGWALQEPDPADERVGLAHMLLATLTAGIILRALVRSVKAARAGGRIGIAIGTIGLVRPRVVVSDAFRKIASGEALAAALAHESAHVLGHDPFRIWLAQIATDLQWPIPGAPRRLSAWLLSLEAQRDNEAMERGASAEDLAEAIVTAARLQSGGAATISAQATGSGDGIAWRVRRLLSPAIRATAPAPRALWIVRASSAALWFGAVWLGLTYGDALIGVLAGRGP